MNILKITDTITKLEFEDRVITLIGTAHVSKNSVEDVKNLIEVENVDHICIELDESRYENATKKQDWASLDLKTVFKQGKGFLLLVNLALSSYQKRLGDKTGIKPGEEILKAAELAKEKNIPFSFCDREIQATLKRAWRKSSFYNKIKLLSYLLQSSFSNEEISEKDLEDLKNQDNLSSLLNELSKHLPMIKTVLIDERDQFLAKKIFTSPGKRIVAVVGAGHCPGIIENMKALEAKTIDINTQKLSFVPQKSKLSKALPYIIPTIIVAIILAGAFTGDFNQTVQAFKYWVIVNAGLTGIMAILSLAHPINIIASMILAPFTSLNPTIGVGFISAIIQVSLKKPRVSDAQELHEQISKVKKWYSNRILHAFLVFIATSIGSAIGTFVAFPMLISVIS